MFEGNNNEGNTPEVEEVTVSPSEAVISKALGEMHEGVSGFLAEDVATLRERVAELEAQRAFYVKESNEWREKWARAATLFEASLEEDGVDTDDLNENTRALVEMFGIEFTKEVEVRVTVTYSGTVTIPKNADVYDVQSGLDYYDSLDLELEGNTVGSISYDDFDIEEL